MGSLAEYLINETARVPSKSGWKAYFGEKVTCAHQIEEITKFFAFRNL